MSDNNFELSRRKILGSLGMIGAASAGAGMGTTAFLNDEESFENNTITAGELDLVVDWQEQYSAAADLMGMEGVRYADPMNSDLGDDELGVPSQKNPLVAIDTTVSGAKTEFLEKTAVDSFPDTDGRNLGDVDGDESDEVGTGTADDGVQDDIPTNDQGGDQSAECNYLQPLVPDAGVLSSAARTSGTVGDGPNPQTTQPGDPLVQITDAKPGDFGEVTFSLHLCGNPGYISMRGDLVDNSENGFAEPEPEDDENGNGSPDPNGPGELLDNTAAVIWYDAGADGEFDDVGPEPTEGDNVLQANEDVIGDEGQNRVLRGSLRTVLNLLDDGIPLNGSLADSKTTEDFNELVPTASSATIDGPTESDGWEDVFQPADDTRFSNKAPTCIGTEYAEAELLEGDVGEFQTIYDEHTDGDASDSNGDSSLTDLGDVDSDGEEEIELDTDAGIATVDDIRTNGAGEVESITLSTDFPVTAVIAKGGSFKNTGAATIWEQPNGGVLDEVQFQPPEFNDKDGRPAFSYLEVCYDPDVPEDTPPAFPNSTTAYIGFAWYVPKSVGNEIQGDSLSFDLGFYAEQARHNDDPDL